MVGCFSIALFAGQMLSWAHASNHMAIPPRPRGESLRALTKEQRAKAMEKWRTDFKQQMARSSEERLRLIKGEAWKRLLRISERQWKIIEPRIDKVEVLIWRRRACAAAWGGIEDFHWRRHSEGVLGPAKAPHEMIEGEKVADQLVDLLEDENSKEEEIRKKIDQLQQVREKARKEWPKAKRELAAVLTTPRQEAVFLIMGRID